MSEAPGYVLGPVRAGRPPAGDSDAHFAETSEQLLDELHLRPQDRVVEFGCGPGGFSRHICAAWGRRRARRRGRQCEPAGPGTDRTGGSWASALRAGPGGRGRPRTLAGRRRRCYRTHDAAPHSDGGVRPGRLRARLRPGTRVALSNPISLAAGPPGLPRSDGPCRSGAVAYLGDGH